MIETRKCKKILSGKGELEFNVFEDLPIMATMSVRSDGNMSLEGGEVAAVNREKFLKELGVPEYLLCYAAVSHGVALEFVDYNDSDRYPNGFVFCNTDGLVTSCTNIYLSVGAADCPTIFLYDPVKEIAGLLHSGWRGLSCGIIWNAVWKMRDLGSDFRDIRAGIGPCICQKDYKFGEEAWTFFGSVPDAITKINGRNHLDLRKVAVYKLRESGVGRENISVSDACTYCDETMFSRRRDGKNFGVMMVVFGMMSD